MIRKKAILSVSVFFLAMVFTCSYLSASGIQKSSAILILGSDISGKIFIRDWNDVLVVELSKPFGKKIELGLEEGEYRVFNQFQEVYDVTELAMKVKKVGNELSLNVEVRNLENPRKEMEEHYYNPDHKNLLDLGYKPTHDVEQELKIMIQDLMKYKDRILKNKEVLIPDIRWDGTKRKVGFLEKRDEETVQGINGSS